MQNRLSTHRFVPSGWAALLLLLLFSAAPAAAQGLTEALQKQVWPQARCWNATDWDVVLPASDTLWLPGDSLAEAIVRDGHGRPAQVQTLTRTRAGWQPTHLCDASFDAEGQLVKLQEWTRDAGHWQPWACMTRTRHLGQDVAFTLQTFEAGEWKTDYAWKVQRLDACCATGPQP